MRPGDLLLAKIDQHPWDVTAMMSSGPDIEAGDVGVFVDSDPTAADWWLVLSSRGLRSVYSLYWDAVCEER